MKRGLLGVAGRGGGNGTLARFLLTVPENQKACGPVLSSFQALLPQYRKLSSLSFTLYSKPLPHFFFNFLKSYHTQTPPKTKSKNGRELYEGF